MDNALVDIFIHPPKHKTSSSSASKSDSKHSHHQIRSSNSKDRHRERLRKKSTTPESTVTIPSSPSRTGILERTASAPHVPSKREPLITIIGGCSDGHAHRDSISSIRDDPFFKNYQTPHAISLARELRVAASNSETTRNEGGKSARAKMEDSQQMNPESRRGMEINIAVIGRPGVGKSTLIQRAFSRRTLPTTVPSSIRVNIDHVAYTVNLIELDLEAFDIPQSGRLQFPRQVDGLYTLPRIDGSMVLYDVMNTSSTEEVPQLLNGLAAASIPTILVSSKCDNPIHTRQVDVESFEADCNSCVEAIRTAFNVPESARACLGSVIRAIMAQRNSHYPADHLGARRRATSSAHIDNKPEPVSSRPLSQNSKHSRASSEHSLLRGFPSPPIASSRTQQNKPNTRTNLHNEITLPDPHDAPPLSAHPAFRRESTDPTSNRLAPGQNLKPPLSSPGKTPDHSFLDMDESDGDSQYRYSEDIPILQRNYDTPTSQPAKIAGVTFDELVDRLLAQRMSRADQNFSDIFLCLYRKFAAPGELFDAITTRLDRVANDKNTHYLIRTSTQLRIITVIAKWITGYPGDFASTSTLSKLDGFIQHLASQPPFAAAAQDMRYQLHIRVVVDDDTGWARTDADAEHDQGQSAPSSPVRTRIHSTNDFDQAFQKLQMDELARQRSTVESSSSGRPMSPATSLAPSYHNVEDYERAAALLSPRNTQVLTKPRYHALIETPDDEVAEEMTRIDWIMFSSIRLRDLFRDVSLSQSQKDKCRSLVNVKRMTDHFQYIARWVTNMILVRDKPKHRAIAYEKFMNIAIKLRQLKNYNGLAAVLAGLNGSAIHRLGQTRALIPADVQKKFATLVVLMSNNKGSFAYRLAWENSSLPRIPFIPLHRRDLTTAEQGSQTFVGTDEDRINWKKFEILGEAILPIMKSQVVPYTGKARDEVRDLILDCRMLDDEDCYQRSLQLEGSTPAADGSKKKFPWFQKDKS